MHIWPDWNRLCSSFRDSSLCYSVNINIFLPHLHFFCCGHSCVCFQLVRCLNTISVSSREKKGFWRLNKWDFLWLNFDLRRGPWSEVRAGWSPSGINNGLRPQQGRYLYFRCKMCKKCLNLQYRRHLHCKSVKWCENLHFGVNAELDEDMEAPSIWLLLRLCTSTFNLQPEHTQNKQNLTGGSFLPHFKSMPLKTSVSVRNNWCEDSGEAHELKLQSCSYRFQQRSCVFFHRSAPQLRFIISFSFLLHPRVIVWALCFSFFPHIRV